MKSNRTVLLGLLAAFLVGQGALQRSSIFPNWKHNFSPGQKSIAGELARRFAALIRGDDDAGLEQWITDATVSELASLAAGLSRDIEAVRAAITQPWSTSPVEGQINRLKTIKRQMYGRAAYPLLRSRLLAAA